MVYWSYGVSPVASFGDQAAILILHFLLPFLLILVIALSILTMEVTSRYEVKSYVGSDPLIKKVSLYAFRWGGSGWRRVTLILFSSQQEFLP